MTTAKAQPNTNTEAAPDMTKPPAEATAWTDRDHKCFSLGAEAERKRVSDILGAEEAKGRSGLAHHLAMQTDTAPAQAISMLLASPVETAAAPSKPSGFQDAMNHSENPDVGAGEGTPDSAPVAKHPLLAAVEDWDRQTGFARK